MLLFLETADARIPRIACAVGAYLKQLCYSVAAEWVQQHSAALAEGVNRQNIGNTTCDYGKESRVKACMPFPMESSWKVG